MFSDFGIGLTNRLDSYSLFGWFEWLLLLPNLMAQRHIPIDFEPLFRHADRVIASTDKPRLILEEAKAWCEYTQRFLQEVKNATRPEDRKKALAHSKLLVLAVGQICKLATALINVNQVPQGTQQNLVKLCEDAKSYAKNIKSVLYPAQNNDDDPFAGLSVI